MSDDFMARFPSGPTVKGLPSQRFLPTVGIIGLVDQGDPKLQLSTLSFSCEEYYAVSGTSICGSVGRCGLMSRINPI